MTSLDFTPTLDQIKALPKALLHDHLDGGLRPETIIEIADEIGYEKLPTKDPEKLAAWFEESCNSGSLVRYLETYRQGMDIARGEGNEIRVESILCALRQNHRDRDAAKAVVKYRDKGVVGFDIAGPEDGYPPTNQLQTFEYLRRENAHFTIHAGEAYGLPSIWEAIQYCGAERLGHGVRIIDDIDFSGNTPVLGRLAAYIRDRRIPLEICPTSNLQTGAAKTIAEHPIGKLSELRFRVTVNTDNRLMSRTSMTNEMYQLVRAFNWTLADLQRVTVNAMKSAFIPFEERLKIIEGVVKPGFARMAS